MHNSFKISFVENYLFPFCSSIVFLFPKSSSLSVPPHLTLFFDKMRNFLTCRACKIFFLIISCKLNTKFVYIIMYKLNYSVKILYLKSCNIFIQINKVFPEFLLDVGNNIWWISTEMFTELYNVIWYIFLLIIRIFVFFSNTLFYVAFSHEIKI